jgi:hypothetical protein
MYHTFRELVVATREKFAAVGGEYNTCRYRPAPFGNGIGCAIGCHFTPEQQAILDASHEVSYCAIDSIMYSSPIRRAVIREVMGPEITTQQLLLLQTWHDSGRDKPFLPKLDQWLADNPEEPITHELFTVPVYAYA